MLIAVSKAMVSLRADQADNALLQPARAARGCGAGFAVAMAQMPASTIGVDRIMPMVSQLVPRR